MNHHLSHAPKGRPTVIVTGASSGLGRSFTRILDETLPEAVDLWLIARRPDKLRATADELRRPVRLFDLDLRDPRSIHTLAETLAAETPDVHLLINNAGVGTAEPFESTSADEAMGLCDLNVRAVTGMTSIVLPYMREGADILLTASVASFLPQPGFATYAASKAYVLSFGRALREELKGRGIHVTITCPNPMLTDFFSDDAREDLLHSYKRIAIEDVDEVAQKTLDAMRRRRVVVVTSPWGRLIRFFGKIIPTGWILRWIRWD
ncbi:MAG: SDR family NAD(P)-dependent oxidoreductase [Saccharofermentanales bacterium]|jgi:short-subunit dehydrogenase